MSVIGFGSSELASVAIVMVGEPWDATSTDVARAYVRACNMLAVYSEANTKAFNRTYKGERALPETSRAILTDVRGLFTQARDRHPTIAIADSIVMACARERASGFAALARYNLISNGGTDFSTVETDLVLDEVHACTGVAPDLVD